MNASSSWLIYIFQFTPLREGRQVNASSSWIIYIFQFTPLREGRPAARKQEEGRQIFQFTPLREGRRFTSPSCSIAQCYFNSRPCGRGDTPILSSGNRKVISIHAPAGGATHRRERREEIY